MSRGFLLVPGFLLRAGWVLAVAISLCASVARAQQPLIVFSAASLKGAFDERAAVFERGGGAPVKVSYGGSLTLARQIDQGAPADVFCAADAQSMAWAQSRQLIDPGSQFILLRNALVVIAPAGAALAGLELNPEAFRRALGDGRLAMGGPCVRASGKIRQGGVGVAWRMERRAGPGGGQRQRARRHALRLARRGAVGARLRHRRQGGAEGQGGGVHPGGDPCAHRVSVRPRQVEPPCFGRAGVSRKPEERCEPGGFRG
jgi:hypothetical protein